MKHYDVCNIHKETLLSVQHSQQKTRILVKCLKIILYVAIVMRDLYLNT